MDRRGGRVTDSPGREGIHAVIDVCPGCGGRMSETGAVNVLCDEKGNPVELLRVCPECADLFAKGSSEARMELFDRIGEIETAFHVCPYLEKQMPVH